jgi:ankyrin repeat protein
MLDIKLSGKLPEDLDVALENNSAEVKEFFDAVLQGSLPLLKLLLLSNKGLVTERNKKLQTPLHVALAEGDFEVITLLIDSGADLHTKDLNGESCLSIVSKNTDWYDM